MSPLLDRRRFLAALGLGGAGLALPGRRALASSDPPKRLIVFSTTQGMVYDSWRMQLGTREASLNGLLESEMSPVLQPLHPYRSRMLALDGLSMLTAELDLSGSRHEKGWIHSWTGAWAQFTGSSIFSSAPSLDQLVASAISRPDRLPGLELQVGEGRPICHAGPAQPLPLEGDPRRVWERLFGLAASDDPLVAAQGSVLDFALGEYDALRAKLGLSDRRRLDSHFDLVRQLEQRIEGLRTISCEGPDLAALAGTSAGYDEIFRSMAELVTAAFSCDLTRVVTLSMGDMPSDDIGWGWYMSGDVHFDFAHQVFADPECTRAMTDFHVFHARQLAYLVGLLESMPDPDGGSLMDHTLIVWGSELADGWHGFRQWCALTLGGGWAFSPGRYLSFPWDSTPAEMVTADGTVSTCGLPHNLLLTSVARAMGVETDSVGLSRVRSRNGEEIDLSGPLPGMVG